LQGRPHSIFKRALQRRNVVAALAAARELPQITLEDALELTLLVARKDPRRHPRLAARWLLRYLEEDPAATVEEVVRRDSPQARSGQPPDTFDLRRDAERTGVGHDLVPLVV